MTSSRSTTTAGRTRTRRGHGRSSLPDRWRIQTPCDHPASKIHENRTTLMPIKGDARMAEGSDDEAARAKGPRLRRAPKRLSNMKCATSYTAVGAETLSDRTVKTDHITMRRPQSTPFPNSAPTTSSRETTHLHRIRLVNWHILCRVRSIERHPTSRRRML